MKNIILALSLFCASFSFAQEFSVDYKIQYTYTHHSNLNALESSNSESLYLFIGENQSVFVNHNIAYEKEIQQRLDEMSSRGVWDYEKAGQIRSEFPKQYYKNLESNEVLVLRTLGADMLAYTVLDTSIVWTILDQEEEEYMGYKVQAATADFAGRSYTAWFTTEIPIPDGPHVFHGLPGLIVDVYDTDKHFRFQLEGIERPEEETIWKIPAYKSIENGEEYNRLYANDRKQVEINTAESIRSGKTEIHNNSTGKPMTVDEYLIWNRKRNSREHINEMELE